VEFVSSYQIEGGLIREKALGPLVSPKERSSGRLSVTYLWSRLSVLRANLCRASIAEDALDSVGPRSDASHDDFSPGAKKRATMFVTLICSPHSAGKCTSI
jgi:hypothetical protein